jgi:outer membrane protein, heavy metal efflux system
MLKRSLSRIFPAILVVCVGIKGSVSEAHAAETLSLRAATLRAKTSGMEVLLAEVRIRAAEGEAKASAALPNPAVTLSLGHILQSEAADPNAGRWQYTAGLSDRALLSELLFGKHGLKKDVGAFAVAAARADRKDAERMVAFATQSAYLDVVGAQKALVVAKEIAELLSKAVALNRLRYPKVIDEGVLARVEAEALVAEERVDRASAELTFADANLSYLLGARSAGARFEVDEHAIDFSDPQGLSGATVDALTARALTARPDAKRAIITEKRAASDLSLAGRQRVPEVEVFAGFQQAGTGPAAVQPPTFTLGLGLPLPIVNSGRAAVLSREAARDAAGLTKLQLQRQIALEVKIAFAAFVSGRRIAARYDGPLLERRRKAFDITKIQYEAGSATLMDFLDAERGLAAASLERLAVLVSYWKSVYALESAVGVEIEP